MSIAPLVHGITLGAAASVIVDASGEIHRNELGGHSSATLVAFTPEGRQLGEAAVMGMAANARGTATEVARLALIPYETLTSGLGALTSRHWQFAHTAGEEGVLVMSDVALSDGQTASMPAVGLLGALRCVTVGISCIQRPARDGLRCSGSLLQLACRSATFLRGSSDILALHPESRGR